MDKMPDVAQLCQNCGATVKWQQWHGMGVVSYQCDCPSCRWSHKHLPTKARNLTPTEQMLLARIAELEDAQRWRVTAEEMPPVGVPVVALRADDPGWPCDIVVRLGSGAWADSSGFTGQPDRWLPIPGAADAR